MPINVLHAKMQPGVFGFISSNQTQSFANYLIQQLIKGQPDLSVITDELVSIWNCIEQNNQTDKIVNIYFNFLNEIFTASHITFFVQAHRVIDQVINGDVSHGQFSDLLTLKVKVERVVDIASSIFKMSSALALFEGTQMTEIPHSMLQTIIQSILSNVKIENEKS